MAQAHACEILEILGSCSEAKLRKIQHSAPSVVDNLIGRSPGNQLPPFYHLGAGDLSIINNIEGDDLEIFSTLVYVTFTQPIARSIDDAARRLSFFPRTVDLKRIAAVRGSLILLKETTDYLAATAATLIASTLTPRSVELVEWCVVWLAEAIQLLCLTDVVLSDSKSEIRERLSDDCWQHVDAALCRLAPVAASLMASPLLQYQRTTWLMSQAELRPAIAPPSSRSS